MLMLRDLASGSFRFRRMFQTLHSITMQGKRILSIISFLAVMVHSICPASESTIRVDGIGPVAVPVGWTQESGTCIGPGRTPEERPRLRFAIAADGQDPTTAAMRTSYLRMGDGCELLDDDRVPIGGRVWNRLRVQFAVGPLAFGQSAWIGTIAGKTVVAVLSAPDDRIGHHLAAATAAIASISGDQR